MGKTKVFLPLAALLLAACGNLTLPGLQPKPFTGALDLPSPLQTVAPGGEVQVPVRATFNDPEVASVTLTVRLADPCAKGTSNCPGWDASRYPGVAHPTGSYALTPASPTAALTFRVDPGALSQGPFKYELVLSGQDASGKAVEEVVPFYLRVLKPGQRSGFDTWNFLRQYAGVPPLQQEDPELAYRGWLHARYYAYNGHVACNPNLYAHSEVPGYPFASPEGASVAGNDLGDASSFDYDPNPPVYSLFIAPFHRFGLLEGSLSTGGYGNFQAVLPFCQYSNVITNIAVTAAGNPSSSPWNREVLVPAPDRDLPLGDFASGENPDPLETCRAPEKAPVPPFLSRSGLSWTWEWVNGVQPRYGFPITYASDASGNAWTSTRVLWARLVRLSDGTEVPVCAYGSDQYYSSDGQYGPAGKNTLSAYGAVLVLPHDPLALGQAYQVSFTARVGGQTVEKTWSFRVADSLLYPLF